jgi:hypothetical protein
MLPASSPSLSRSNTSTSPDTMSGRGVAVLSRGVLCRRLTALPDSCSRRRVLVDYCTNSHHNVPRKPMYPGVVQYQAVASKSPSQVQVARRQTNKSCDIYNQGLYRRCCYLRHRPGRVRVIKGLLVAPNIIALQLDVVICRVSTMSSQRLSQTERRKRRRSSSRAENVTGTSILARTYRRR